MYRVSSMEPQQQGSLQRITEDGSARPHQGTLLLTSGLRRGTAVNVVLYLHGNMFSGFEALRTRVLSSVAGANKPLVFAMPSLENVPALNSWISTQGNFDNFLDGVLLAAGQQMNEDAAHRCLVDRDQEWNGNGPTGRRVAPAALGNLIIAAHSGGGFPMLTIVNNGSSKLRQLKELWFFDCLYAGLDQNWITWARAHSSVDLEILYTVYSLSPVSATLARSIGAATTGRRPIPNVRHVSQEPSNNHNDVPPNNIGRLIRASTNL